MNAALLIHRACAVMAALSIASSLSASPVIPRQTGSFTRFSAAYVDPRQIGIDVGWGAFAAVGARFQDGEATVEVGQIRLDQSETILGYEGTADLRVTSAMVGGRYGVRLGKSDRVRLMLGGMAGFAHLAFSGSANIDGDLYAIKTSSTGATWALDLGLVVGLSEKLELSLGYRYMGVDGTEWDAFGYTFEIPHQTANIYQAGLGYRW